jgi:hypothetical protein
MRSVNRFEQSWLRPQGHHREGVIEFLPLLQGENGRPDHFVLNIARFEEYFTPRHRHNYDQIRYCFNAPFPYAKDKVIPAGWIGYFPEGTPYGPQDVRCELENGPEILTWQFGGASGQGFVSAGSLRDAYEALAVNGRFERGFYLRQMPDGSERKQDGYEAAWAAASGQELVYPPARFSEPVLMDPAAFVWRDTAEVGVQQKRLATFEPQLSLWFTRLANGAEHQPVPHQAIQHAYVLEGDVQIAGGSYGKGTVIELGAGESFPMTAGVTGVELFWLALPVLGPTAS